jgi:enoyl-CoA hydratase
MAGSLVQYDVTDGFATVTLDSPDNRNALSPQLEHELAEALATAAEDPGARAVVLAHTGRFFCAGADVGASPGDTTPEERTRGYFTLLRSMVEHPKPIIAKVDGHARAGGLGLIAACDLAVAGPESSFAVSEVRWGITPFGVSLTFLTRVSPRAGARYVLTGEKFDAPTAQEIGLVTVAADDTDAAIGQLCAALALASPQALADSKRVVNAAIVDGFDRLTDEYVRRMLECAESDDVAEGMAALGENRLPRWAPAPA